MQQKKENNANYFYGVNVNDKRLVKKEYDKLKSQHQKFNILVTIFIALLIIPLGDFILVNFLNFKPVLAIKETVDNGVLYHGIGYNVYICNDGQRYNGSYNNRCTNEFANNFISTIHDSLVEYFKDKKITNKNFEDIDIKNISFDENISKKENDYYINISFKCKKNRICYKEIRPTDDPYNIDLYIRINKYNKISSIINFKTSGIRYNQLIEEFKIKMINYYEGRNILDSQKLRNLTLYIQNNYGKLEYNNEVYSNSYLVNVQYMCKQNNNDCIKYQDEMDYNNLSFEVVVLTDNENNIRHIASKQILNK